MTEEKKIKLDDLLQNLQAQEQYEKGISRCQEAFSAWLCARKLPKTCIRLGTKPPARVTIRTRLKVDGYIWLKEEEVNSFERYVGRKMWVM